MNNNWIYIDKNKSGNIPDIDVWVWDEDLENSILILREEFLPTGKYSWYMPVPTPKPLPKAYFNIGDTVTIVDDLGFSNHGEKCVIDSYVHYSLTSASSEIGYRLKGQEGIYLNNDFKEFKQK